MCRVSLFSTICAVSLFLSLGSSRAERLCPTDEGGAQFYTTLAARPGGAMISKRLLRLDRDRDGLPDCLESALGLNPKSQDSDADGVDDGDENLGESTLGDLYLQGHFDSDGDGLSDASERSSGPSAAYVFSALRSPFSAIAPTLRTASATVAASKCKKLKGVKKKKCLKKYAVGASPSPSASASDSATPKPTAKPTATATPTTTSGGDAGRGRSFFSSNCTSCHGTQRVSSESQLKSILDTQPQHVLVKGMVNSQTLKDVAAYLMSQ